MAKGGVIIDSKHHNDWIVPRRVMCAFFWIGIILLFTGIILLVTSKHKGELYQSWGAILLGLGFCLLLICLILCLHAYCVITITDEELPAKTNIPPPAPPSAAQDDIESMRSYDEEDDGRPIANNNVVFDLGASSPPATPDALDEEEELAHNRFILKSASSPQVPVANGDITRDPRSGSQPAALASWRSASGRSAKAHNHAQAYGTEEGPKPLSRVGSPYYVEDPVSRVQTPFGSSHALTPLHMIDTEASKPSASKHPPEIHDGTHYQGMAPYDNAAIPSKTPAREKSTSRTDLPYDNCDRPAIADAAELIRMRAKEACNGPSERPGSAHRPGTGASTPISRRNTPVSPRVQQGSPRGTPNSVRGTSASPRATPANNLESRSATPGSTRGTPTRGTPVSTEKDGSSVVEESPKSDSEVISKTRTDEKDLHSSPSFQATPRPRPPLFLTRQVPIPEGSEVDEFEDRSIDMPDNKATTSEPYVGPTSSIGKSPFMLPGGGIFSAPRSAFTSVPPSDMRLHHPRPQRFPPSGERILNLPPGMRPPFALSGEPRRFNQPVVVYLNPNMQASDSKVSVYDNVQLVWSDQNPNQYQPYTQGDKTYCDV